MICYRFWKNIKCRRLFCYRCDHETISKWLKKIHQAGHEIENHSWEHENFKKLFVSSGTEAIKLNLEKTEETICEATGVCRIPGRHRKFFRPPFWEINEEIEKIITSEGYTVMKPGHPDINTLDYKDCIKNRPALILVERVKKLSVNGKKMAISRMFLFFMNYQ